MGHIIGAYEKPPKRYIFQYDGTQASIDELDALVAVANSNVSSHDGTSFTLHTPSWNITKTVNDVCVFAVHPGQAVSIVYDSTSREDVYARYNVERQFD